jgi:hypothetical protein
MALKKTFDEQVVFEQTPAASPLELAQSPFVQQLLCHFKFRVRGPIKRRGAPSVP